jgi:hypothetical protein
MWKAIDRIQCCPGDSFLQAEDTGAPFHQPRHAAFYTFFSVRLAKVCWLYNRSWEPPSKFEPSAKGNTVLSVVCRFSHRTAFHPTKWVRWWRFVLKQILQYLHVFPKAHY